MIKELNKNNETNWYEKIQLEMSLQDLQIIFDCIGAIPTKYLEFKHRNTKFGLNYTYNDYCDLANNIYEDLEQIISKHNGITDDDMMINNDIELKLEEGA